MAAVVLLYFTIGCASAKLPPNADALKEDEMGKIYGYRILMESTFKHHSMRLVEYENRLGKLRIESKENLRVAGEASKKNVAKVFGQQKLRWLIGLGYHLVEESEIDSSPLFADKKWRGKLAENAPQADNLPKFDEQGCRVLVEQQYNGQTIQIKEYRNDLGNLRLESPQNLWLSGEVSKKTVKNVFGEDKLKWLLTSGYHLVEESLVDNDPLFSARNENIPIKEATANREKTEEFSDFEQWDAGALPVFGSQGSRILLQACHKELTLQVKEYRNHIGKLKLECKEKLWFSGDLSQNTARKLFGKNKLQWLLELGYHLPGESIIDNDPLLQ